MVSSARLCLMCKGGKNLCGHSPCPLLARLNLQPKLNKKLSTEFFGPSPSIFIGHVGYPYVNVGPLAAIEIKPNIDNPANWFELSYSDIVELRSLLLRSKIKTNVHAKNRIVREGQELALAEKPTDIELEFKKKPVYKMTFSDVHQPMGPSAQLQKLRIAENPKIPRKVEYIVTDDIKANTAAGMLYANEQDVYKISTILSSGIMGLERSQKMVPTRWSITAVDDIVTKQMLNNIREFPSVNEFRVYSGQYLDNHFEILLMPGNFEYENFEAWSPKTVWGQYLKGVEIVEEYEPYQGRTKYADKEGGGYYAARLGVVEALHAMKRQARVVVFREIYEGYTIPLGVWVVRENARCAMQNKPMSFATQAEALGYIDSKLKLPIEKYIEQSKILRQKRLVDFI